MPQFKLTVTPLQTRVAERLLARNPSERRLRPQRISDAGSKTWLGDLQWKSHSQTFVEVLDLWPAGAQPPNLPNYGTILFSSENDCNQMPETSAEKYGCNFQRDFHIAFSYRILYFVVLYSESWGAQRVRPHIWPCPEAQTHVQSHSQQLRRLVRSRTVGMIARKHTAMACVLRIPKNSPVCQTPQQLVTYFQCGCAWGHKNIEDVVAVLEQSSHEMKCFNSFQTYHWPWRHSTR